MRPVLSLLPATLCVLAACSPVNPPAAPPPPAAAATAEPPAALAQALPAQHWQLAEARDAGGARIEALFPDPQRPLQLDFLDGRLSVSGGCNRLSGEYRLDGDAFSAGPFAQTKMFCGGGALMAADEAIAARLSAPGLRLRLEDGRLHLEAAGGERLEFEGVATADTRHGGPGEQVFLEVAPQRVACHHAMIPDYRCLHVREVRYDEAGLKTGTGEWEFLYQDIEGYTHQPGVRNVLRLKRYDIANPPADASSVAYVLDMVVESETVSP